MAIVKDDPPGDESTLAEHLQRLGLSLASSKAYLHLLQAGPTRASSLATALGTSRDEAYRRVHILMTSGFAWATLTGPIMYVAAAPERLFRVLHEQRLRETDAVRQVQIDLVPILRAIHRTADPTHTGAPLRVLNGRERVFDHLHEVIDNSLHELMMVQTHPAGARLATEAGLLRRLQQCSDVGLRVHLLLADSATARRRGLEIQSPTCKVRLLPAVEATSFVISDQRVMSFYAATDPSPYLQAARDCAVVTQAAAFIEMQRNLFGHLWEKSEPA